jgi:putative component of membrane protein insertase Oxa1/YidC/SpoIIIJ protein YidD
MKYTILLCFVFAINLFPQVYKYGKELNTADWQKWSKADYSYIIPGQNLTGRNYSLSGENFGGKILKTFADAYWFFISDVDGDNCSFKPTCSSFFVLAVNKTNLVQGTLMFADRFTRDLDLFKLNHYPRVEDGHFYDPVDLYTLNKKDLKIITPESVVKNE